MDRQRHLTSGYVSPTHFVQVLCLFVKKQGEILITMTFQSSSVKSCLKRKKTMLGLCTVMLSSG